MQSLNQQWLVKKAVRVPDNAENIIFFLYRGVLCFSLYLASEEVKQPVTL